MPPEEAEEETAVEVAARELVVDMDKERPSVMVAIPVDTKVVSIVVV